MAPKSFFVNGVPELLVLRLLAQREMYGYQLIKAMRLSTREQLKLGEGVVYPLLHALESDGSLGSRRVQEKGRPRVYYQLTAKGRKRLAEMVAEWGRVTSAVDDALAQGGEPSNV